MAVLNLSSKLPNHSCDCVHPVRRHRLHASAACEIGPLRHEIVANQELHLIVIHGDRAVLAMIVYITLRAPAVQVS